MGISAGSTVLDSAGMGTAWWPAVCTLAGHGGWYDDGLQRAE